MVPQIEDIHPRGELMTLSDPEVFDQREVPVLLHWPAEGVARKIPVSCCAGGSVGNQWSTTDEVRIEVMIDPASAAGIGMDVPDRGYRSRRTGAQRKYLLRQWPANQRSRSDNGAERSARGAICQRERQTALISNDAADRPALKELILEEIVLWDWDVIRVTDNQPVWTIKITACFVCQRQRLVVEDIAATLPGASRIKFIRALRTADIVDGFGEGVRRLEIHPMAQAAGHRSLQGVVGGKSYVSRVTRPAHARKAENLVPQRFVVHGARGDRVARAVNISHGNGISRSGYRCEERIPDSQPADKVRADVANFDRPTSPDFSLHGQVPLLRVRCVRARGNAGVGGEVDRTICGGPTKVCASLTRFVHEDWANARIVNVERSTAADPSQSGEPAGLRNERRGNRRRRWDVRKRILQLE